MCCCSFILSSCVQRGACQSCTQLCEHQGNQGMVVQATYHGGGIWGRSGVSRRITSGQDVTGACRAAECPCKDLAGCGAHGREIREWRAAKQDGGVKRGALLGRGDGRGGRCPGTLPTAGRASRGVCGGRATARRVGGGGRKRGRLGRAGRSVRRRRGVGGWVVGGHGTEAIVAAYECVINDEWAAFGTTSAGPASRGANNWKNRGSLYKLRSTEAEYGGRRGLLQKRERSARGRGRVVMGGVCVGGSGHGGGAVGGGEAAKRREEAGEMEAG